MLWCVQCEFDGFVDGPFFAVEPIGVYCEFSGAFFHHAGAADAVDELFCLVPGDDFCGEFHGAVGSAAREEPPDVRGDRHFDCALEADPAILVFKEPGESDFDELGHGASRCVGVSF